MQYLKNLWIDEKGEWHYLAKDLIVKQNIRDFAYIIIFNYVKKRK